GHPYPAPMRFQNGFYHVQAETGSTVRLLRGVKRLKEACQRLGGAALPVILHPDPDLPVPGPQADADGSGSRLAGVPEKVQEDPLQLCRVPGDGGQWAAGFDPEDVARLVEMLRYARLD